MPQVCKPPAVMTLMRWWKRAAYLTIGLIWACDRTITAAPSDYSRTPVLFVHGHGMSSGIWQEMMNHLVSLGYPREYLYAVDIIPNDMANVKAATTVLEPAATSLLENAKVVARSAGYQGEASQRLDIVSHSMGAVSSRWYTVKLHPELVRTWISVAGANHGTNVLCGYTDEAAREMCPAFATSTEKSAVQVALNGTTVAPLDETPYGLGIDGARTTSIPPDSTRSILYFTLRIELDEWIKPENSAVLNGAGGAHVRVPSGVPVKETSPGNYLFQAKVGHDPLPKHPDLIHFVAALLAARDQ
ncbi:MAG: esterase/lipase family protein [Nitrososphaera sp.]